MANARTTRVAAKKAAAKKPQGSALDGFFEAVGERLGGLFTRMNGAEQQLESVSDRLGSAETTQADHERRIVELENPPYDEAKLRLLTGEIRALK